jgi:ribosomal protein S14
MTAFHHELTAIARLRQNDAVCGRPHFVYRKRRAVINARRRMKLSGER